MEKDIEHLLDLNGWVADQGNGFWIKVEAWVVEPSPEIPHGIRYSLTLHDRYGKRILGYDNAHAVRKPKKHGYVGRIIAYDHKHRHSKDKGIPYTFTSASQLLEDFFADVDRVIKEVERRR